MLQHLERALELDPGDALTHSYLAEALHQSKDFERGVVHARKAVEFNPTLADGHSIAATFASTNQQHDQAIEFADLSLQIDPFHPWAGWNAGEIYRNAGDYERAIDTFRALPHLSVSVHAQIAACLAGLDRLDEAREEMHQYLELAQEQMISMPASKDEWHRFWEETMPYKHKEDTDRYFDLLMQAGLCDDIVDGNDEMPSLLVLPFSNLSGDPEQEYFSDGISESLIVNLSSFSGLTVKSRHTSFAYKNSEKSIEEIAASLEVQYMLEGSIRKFGSKVRITVQLSETESGNQLWGKRFESDLDDLFSIEEELVQTIAGSISGRIGKDLKSASMHKPAKDLKSYDHLMRGIYHLEKFNAKDNLIAQQEFQKCLKHDPDNPEAHSYLSGSYSTEVYENWSNDQEESKRLMMTHAKKALELEPDNALANAFMG